MFLALAASFSFYHFPPVKLKTGVLIHLAIPKGYSIGAENGLFKGIFQITQMTFKREVPEIKVIRPPDPILLSVNFNSFICLHDCT